jgi:hypothetical protein
MPQRDNRIRLRRPPGRQVTCRQRYSEKQYRHAAQCLRVERAHLEKQSGDGAGQAGRCEETNHEADPCDPRALAHHQPQDIGLLCSHGHADADLMGALGHSIRDYAVDSDCGQQQSQPGE